MDKDIKYPKYVNELFKELPKEIKDKIVKSVIFLNIEEYGKEFKISSFFQNKSNRIEILPKDEVIKSLVITEYCLRHDIYHKRYTNKTNKNG